MTNFTAIVSAIFILEGGTNTHYPYGIKSIHTSSPARVCLVTVSNTHARWVRAGRTNEFYDFLADRYCPASVDPVGNRNWKKNIRKLCPTK